jgi:hypothetical protein
MLVGFVDDERSLRASGPPHQNTEKRDALLKLLPQWLHHNKRTPFLMKAGLL